MARYDRIRACLARSLFSSGFSVNSVFIYGRFTWFWHYEIVAWFWSVSGFYVGGFIRRVLLVSEMM